MKRMFCALVTGVLCAAGGVNAANTFTLWTGADGTDPTDLARPANWEGGAVPVIDTGTMDGPFGKFYSLGTVTVPLTLSEDLFLNGLVFDSVGTAFDLDLTGRTLRLYGYSQDSHSLTFRTFRNVPETIRVRGGTLDMTDGKQKTVYVDGASDVSFSGTELRGGIQFRTLYGANVCLTNGVTGSAYFTTFAGTKTVIAGTGTEIIGAGTCSIGNTAGETGDVFHVLDGAYWTNANACVIGYAGYGNYGLISNATVYVTGGNLGAGSNGQYASNNVFEVKGGARVHVRGSNGKSLINHGRWGYNNTLRIAGEGTFVDWWTNDHNDGSVVVGEMAMNNLLHVTDGARLGTNGCLGVGFVGNIYYGNWRGDSIGNTLKVDGGAQCYMANLCVGGLCTGRMDPYDGTNGRNTYKRGPNGERWQNTDFDLSISSNAFIVSGSATRAQLAGSLQVAGKTNEGPCLAYVHENDFNRVRVEDGAELTVGSVSLGKWGVSNHIEVVGGALLSVTTGNTGYYDGFSFGGFPTTGTWVRVSGANSRLSIPNSRLALMGCPDGRENKIEISDGALVTAKHVNSYATNNVFHLNNGTLTVTDSLICPNGDANGAKPRFIFEGDAPRIRCTSTDDGCQFKTEPIFEFRIPEKGFADVPVKSSGHLRIYGEPTLVLDGRCLRSYSAAGGGTQVLFEAAEGKTLTITPERIAKMSGEAAAVLDGCAVTLVDKRKLVLSVPDRSGTLIRLH